jgi:predicted acetyltransferase
MDFQIKTFHQVPKKYERQIDKLIEIVFPVTDKNRDMENEEFFDLDGSRIGRTVATLDGKVIGKISLYQRLLEYKNIPIKLGGIGGVCTDPEYRRQGVASSLLPYSLAALKKAKCDIVFLGVDINSLWKIHLYEKLGFSFIPGGYNFIGKTGIKHKRLDGMILSLNTPYIVDMILKDNQPFFIGSGRW